MLAIFKQGVPKKPGHGPVITKVTVPRPVKKPAAPAVSSYTKASSSSHGHDHGQNGGSSSKTNGHTKPSVKGKEKEREKDVSRSSSSKSRSGTSSSGKVTSKPTTAAAAASGSAAGSRSSTPLKKGGMKRKVSDYSRIESESESEGEDAMESDLFGDPTSQSKSKRTRVDGSTPVFGGGEERVGAHRRLFASDSGASGWEGFESGEDVIRGIKKGWTGDGEVKEPKSLLDKYVAYFPQEGFEKQDPLPFVELQYPAKGCKEKFLLLNPTAGREYAPLRELRATIQQILEFYIPPSHRHVFGSLSDSLELDSPSLSRMQSPTPTHLNGSGSPAYAASSPPSTPGPSNSETIGDAIRKALAPNRRDGPGFVRAMERFNIAMQEIQNDGSMAQWLELRGKEVKAREWAKLVDIVHDQAYSRIVGPYSNELEHHPKHPDEVAEAITDKEDAYGELRHNFMTKIIEQTGLNKDSVFVDLGSGVGNCVTQVALQAGSKSSGFELLPVPAHCARLQVQETKKRWAMWCLAGNPDVEVHEGDFRTIPAVAKNLQNADVVLVNNEVFPSSLNIDLTHMFLDLKDGAKIVSLKPFVPEGFRMNDSNCDSFAAIVKLASHHYAQGWVSWKGDSGRYYIQTIDRSARLKYEQRASGSRSSRR